MVEDERSLQKRPDEQRNIVVRHEQTGIEQIRRDPFLAKVGFSHLLGQRLMRLNDVLLEKDDPKISSVGITMVPGKTPLITTDVRHGEGMRVLIEGESSGLANLQLDSNTYLGVVITIKDIQDFVKSLFPDKKVRVFSYANPELEEPLKDLDEDIYSLNSEVLKPFMEFRKAKTPPERKKHNETLPYYDFEVRLSDQELPRHKTSLLLFRLRTGGGSDRVGCSIKEFNYRGRPNQVEEVLDKIIKLFDKPLLYPFREAPSEDEVES